MIHAFNDIENLSILRYGVIDTRYNIINIVIIGLKTNTRI